MTDHLGSSPLVLGKSHAQRRMKALASYRRALDSSRFYEQRSDDLEAGENGVGVQKFNRNGVLGKQDKGIPVAASFDLVSAIKWLKVVFRQGAQQWWVMKRVGEWGRDGPVASKVWLFGWEFSHEGTKTPRL